MNYPDDIRQYDDNPRSPFYDDADEWLEEAVMKRALEIAQEMIAPEGFSDNGVLYNMDAVTEHVFSNERATERFHYLLACVVDDSDIFADHVVLKSFLLQQATEVAEDIAWREAG